MSSTTGAPPLCALLVGIDRYPDCDLYPDLEGCVTDVAAVERYLLDVLEVPPERIETLVAPAARQDLAPAYAPTYEGLTSALRRLEASCREGEHALFHFSGHGGRTPTGFPELKGPAAKDECLVPVDVADPGTRYLRDVELAAWIRRMVAKGVFVTLVLDCCHSGGLRRRHEPKVRGGRRIDPTPRPVDSLLVTPGEVAGELTGAAPGRPRAAWNGGASRTGPRILRHAAMTGETRLESQGYALFAACRAREKAHELSFDGERPAGALTHFLLRALERLGGEATYRQLHAAVVEGVHSRLRNQTPVFEGESRALPLGHRELPRLPGLEVLGVARVEAATDAVTGAATDATETPRLELSLGAGRLQGIGEGARFELHPLAAAKSGSPRSKPPAIAEVIRAEATRCRAVVRQTAGFRPRPGDRAVWVDPGPDPGPDPSSGFRRRRVGLPESPPEAGQELVAEIGRRLAAGEGVRLAPADGDRAELRIHLGPGREVRICDEAGAPLPHVPSLGTGDPGAAERLWRALEHLARYESLRTHGNDDFTSPLFGAIGLSLEIEGEGRGEAAGYPPEIPTGCPLVLTVENRSYLPLHLVLLDLQPDWGVRQIVPETLGSVQVDPEGRFPIRLRAHLPEGIDAGNDVLKVFVAEGSLDCRWLELPPLSEVVAGRAGVPSWRSGGWRREAWVTAQTEVRVVRHA